MTDTNILIVEDEGIVAQDLAGQLRALGYGIAGIAESGTEAVRLAEAGRPDLVLMDIRLRDGMDGIEAAEEIRTRLSLPVVYLSAHADDGTLRRARRTEPHGYLQKPFHERELRSVVEMAVYKHQAEQRLRQSERRFATTLQHVGDAVLTISDRGEVMFANRAAEQLLDHAVVDLIGRDVATALPLLDLAGVPLQWHDDQDFVGRLRRRGGGVRDVEGHVASVRPVAQGEPCQVIVLRDITVRLAEQAVQAETRERMQRVQKLESLAQLAGSIAHDLNNLLTSVLGNAELALRALPKDHAERALVGGIVVAARQAAELAAQMLVYSGRAVFEPTAVDLGRLVDGRRGLLAAMLPEAVRLDVEAPAQGPVLLGEAAQLQRLLCNLVLNASEAMPAGGVVTVRVGECDGEAVDPSRCWLPGPPPAGRMAFLDVIDQGPGIAPELLPRLFDPFFSTRRGQRGLGLPAVLGIVRGHGGVIGVHSARGRGTSFSVLLPLRADAATAAPAPPPPPPPRAVKGDTVLVVEDQRHLRDLVRSAISNQGIPVIGAAGLAAGRKIVQQQAAHLQLVMIDLTLEDGTGTDLVPEIRRLRPDVPIVLISGHADIDVAGLLADGVVHAFLAKPFGVQQLLEVVHRFVGKR